MDENNAREIVVLCMPWRIRGMAFPLGTPSLMESFYHRLVQIRVPPMYPLLMPYKNIPKRRVIPDPLSLTTYLKQEFEVEELVISLNFAEAIKNCVNLYLEGSTRRFLDGLLHMHPILDIEDYSVFLHPSLYTPGMEISPAPDPNGRKPLIFVADENFPERMEEILEGLGQLTIASCAFIARALLGLADNGGPSEIRNYELICAEYGITEYGGIEAAGFDLLLEVKESNRWRDVPFVMLSTETDMALVNKCLEAGATMFIMKHRMINPQDAVDFQDVLKKLLF